MRVRAVLPPPASAQVEAPHLALEDGLVGRGHHRGGRLGVDQGTVEAWREKVEIMMKLKISRKKHCNNVNYANSRFRRTINKGKRKSRIFISSVNNSMQKYGKLIVGLLFSPGTPDVVDDPAVGTPMTRAAEGGIERSAG